MIKDEKIQKVETLHRLHAVIAFDRCTVGDTRKPPDTLASVFGALNAANIAYLRTFKRASVLTK